MNALQALRHLSEEKEVQVSSDGMETWQDLTPVGVKIGAKTCGFDIFNSYRLNEFHFRLKPSIENVPTYHIITPSDSEGPDYNRTIMPHPFDRHTIPLNAWYRDPKYPDDVKRITTFDSNRIRFGYAEFMTYEGLMHLGWEYSEDGRTNWNPCHRRDV